MVQQLADWVVYGVIGLVPETKLAAGLNFFVYDTIKIGLLLVAVNYLMAITRYYFPMQRARTILSKRRWSGLNYLLAALLGIVTPFCSCSSIPLFIGFVGAGIPLGVTFAFLISSPLVNESSLYLFPAMFGFKVTVLYNLLGLMVAVLGGMLIEKLKMDHYLRPELVQSMKSYRTAAESQREQQTWLWLARHFWKGSLFITKRIFPYVVLGVGVGAIIHGFVPGSWAGQYLSSREWWTVPLAVLLGVPMYANSVSVLPVMEAMAGKGVPLGTILAFMTAIVTLSIPEALILRKVMRWQLLAVFFGITTLGIMVMGFLFNLIY